MISVDSLHKMTVFLLFSKRDKMKKERKKERRKERSKKAVTTRVPADSLD
jgi:GTP-binding protein EngB required for normal cell division